MKPSGCTWNPCVDGGFEPRRIVQAARLDGNISRRHLTPGEQRRTAFGAKSTIGPATRFTRDPMIFRLAAQQTQSRFANQRNGNEGAAACALAIAAMAIEHGERRLDALIAYGATGAPALVGNYDRGSWHVSAGSR